MVKNGPQHPDVVAEGKTASILTDNKKISLLEGEWYSNDLYKFIFPSRFGKNSHALFFREARGINKSLWRYLQLLWK